MLLSDYNSLFAMSMSDFEYNICTQEDQYKEQQQKRALCEAQKELLDLLNAPAIKDERELERQEEAHCVADEVEEDSFDDISALTQDEAFLA